MMDSLRVAVVVLAVTAAVALSARAQDAAAHKAWMDDAGDLQEELAEQLTAESADKAADAALKLVKILEQTQAYWTAKHADDIVAIARESRALAAQVATDAKAGRFAAATDANRKLNARCSACHDLHPEKR